MKKLLALAMLGLFNTGYSQLTSSLQACYSMDCTGVNGATTGIALNATTVGLTCVNDRNGNANSAYHFCGSATCYFQVPGNSFTKPTTAISVSGWYRSTSASVSSTQYLVYANNGCSSNQEAYYLAIVGAPSNYRFKAGKGFVGSGGSCGSNAATNPSTLTVGNWYHVVFCINTNTVELYVNGIPVAGAAVSLPFTYASSANIILGGSAVGSNPLAFTGDMDNVKFYDRMLSASEVASLYSADPACPSAVTPTTNPPTSGGCCLGNICGSTSNPLTSNYEIPLNKKDFFFTNNGPLQNKVNVGYNCGSSTVGKFSSFSDSQTNNNPSIGVSPYSAAIFGHSSLNTIGNVENVGVMGVAENYGPNNITSVNGVWGSAIADGGDGIGVRGTSEWVNTHTNFGGSFYASHGLYNIGVNGTALSSSGNPAPLNYQTLGGVANVGVYGACWDLNPAGSPPTSDYAGWFDGDVNFVGNVYGSQFSWTSDKRFKKGIKEIENVSEKISKLKGYTYEFKTDEFKNRNFPKGEQIGFIAQELKEVFPQLVVDDKQGYLAVNYVGFIPVLLQAIKEQQKQLDEQKQLIAELSQKSGNATGVNNLNAVENGFQMSQNEPNPFTHETVVKYTLPQTINTAFMAVYDLTGKQVTTFPIRDKGTSSITITSQNLAAGIYIYSIVADGKVVDSKRMIVADK